MLDAAPAASPSCSRQPSQAWISSASIRTRKRWRLPAQKLTPPARTSAGNAASRGTSTLPADVVVTSLMFHQVPMAEKQAGRAAMYAALRPGGRLVIADYGRQRGLMRLLFRLTIQRLDGVADTQPNADGALPRLVRAAGFGNVREAKRI